MSDPTFFWHDYETFGRIPRRDRPAQFAGLRSDADLREVDDPVMLYCQPAPDTLPDPEACLLTGITPQQCLEKGIPEHAFAAAIEAQLARPGTIGVGYNSIRFDDEVTRHLFWRNLIDPYAREWQNQCGRWDLLDVVRLTWALRPEGVTWPTHDDGRPSFKLEHLTRVNGLSHEAAHDALSDVRATLGLARLIRDAQPRLWDFGLRMRRKEEVLSEIGVGKPFLHVSGMYGVERGCMALVWPIGLHPVNKNEWIVWDLAHDPAELFRLDADTIRMRMFSKTEDLPEGVTRLPIKTLHINKSPMVVGNLKVLTPATASKWGLDIDAGLRHAEQLAAQGDKLKPMWPSIFSRPVAAAADVDEDLYGGFISNDDRRRLEGLRKTPATQWPHQAQAFSDARLAELVFRYRARNFPQTLSAEDQQRWEHHRALRLLGDGRGASPLQDFFDRIDALNESADERGQDILAALYDYAEQIVPVT